MILILTYAKVCTTSITQLLTERFPGEVYNSHGLGAWLNEPLARIFASDDHAMRGLRLFHDQAPAIASRLAEAMASGEQVTVISGVRDPIARSLSVAMQNFESCFMDCMAHSTQATADIMAARITDLWLRDASDEDPVRTWLELMIRAPFLWFQEEIEKPFGFDLKAHPFDHDRGYSILFKDNVRLLLFRQENVPTAIETGLAELFPEIDVTLPHVNEGGTKSTGDIYRALQNCFRLPRAALEEIYTHPEVKSYYKDNEITAAINRWAAPPPPRTWVTPPPPAAPRPAFVAAVFIPVRNHAEWIGAQLDSLFAQWRRDIELILVDDGSTDNSFNVVLDRLATRPDVTATLMRNGTAIGHGMLPHIIKLSKAPIIIQADSDDITLPGRLDVIINHFNSHPDCRLVTTNAVLISEEGIPSCLLDTNLPDAILDDPIALADQQNNPYWLGASSAFHRSIIETFEPLDPELCPYGLDLLTGFRATLLGSQHYLARPLVGWRQHSHNSHRMIGALNSDPAALEHTAAVYVMVKAQRLRDVACLRAQGKLDPTRAAMIEARWQADYTSKIDEWIRLRNRVTGTHAAPEPNTASKLKTKNTSRESLL
ncbi:Putative glycosyltransferase (fragment) [Magnetospirillum molischianum DSM 120]|uniref:Putative glycosyltransferase n=2 Tax=Magnetospirillum molischianum TaxID=1083 RepID=H8FRZ7_MAGML